MQKVSERVKATLRPRPAGDVDRLHHRVARRLRVPEIAFEIEDRGALDLRLVERGGRQQLGGAEEGVHRPVRVGRDQHHRARGRLAEVRGRGDELDAGGGEVVPVEFAELVGRDLADEARFAAERRDPRRGIASRAAADLARRAHMVVEPRRLLGVDQPHHPLGQPLALEESVVAIGDDVDDRIADREHVEAGRSSFAPGGSGPLEHLEGGRQRPTLGKCGGRAIAAWPLDRSGTFGSAVAGGSTAAIDARARPRLHERADEVPRPRLSRRPRLGARLRAARAVAADHPRLRRLALAARGRAVRCARRWRGAGGSASASSCSASTGSRPPSPIRRRCRPGSAGSRWSCCRSTSPSIRPSPRPRLALAGQEPDRARAAPRRRLDRRRMAARDHVHRLPLESGRRALARLPVVAGLAALIGTYGLSALVVLAGGALCLLARRQLAGRRGVRLPILAAAVLPIRSASPSRRRRRRRPLRIVQPNIGQQNKWQRGYERGESRSASSA